MKRTRGKKRQIIRKRSYQVTKLIYRRVFVECLSSPSAPVSACVSNRTPLFLVTNILDPLHTCSICILTILGFIDCEFLAFLSKISTSQNQSDWENCSPTFLRDPQKWGEVLGNTLWLLSYVIFFCGPMVTKGNLTLWLYQWSQRKKST